MNFTGNLRFSRCKLCVLAAVVAASQASLSFGAMTLQAPFSSQFTLSTFASGFAQTGFNPPDTYGIGTIGVGFDAGYVYVSQFFTGPDGKNFYAFPSRTLGQTIASPGVLSTNFGSFQANGIANLNGHVYVASGGGYNQINEVSISGNTINVASRVDGITSASALVASTVNNQVYVSMTNTTINSTPVPPRVLGFDGTSLIPPAPITHRDFAAYDGNSNVEANSFALSGDQNTLYVLWGNGHIMSYSTATGVGYAAGTDLGTVDSNIFGGKCGMVAGSGDLAGLLFLNGSNGSLYEFNTTTAALTAIATGGTYGQFMAADPTTGKLYITQSDSVLVLSPSAPTAWFASTPIPDPAPEPASLSLLGLGGLALLRRRR